MKSRESLRDSLPQTTEYRVKPPLRDYFDTHLETVLAELPDGIHTLLEKVPLHVEDHPSDRVLREVGIRRRQNLCGLYTGIPLTEKSVDHSGTPPDVVTIYREGVMASACDERGHLSEEELRRQIKITVLHEIGHHHGLDEDDLAELGYG